ncbi:double-stranded RNA binding motif domain-containing protein [Streptomyces caelestis]|uniref:Double-stranded RNA binding motif domain-containing protein n=1 Tax=Streptomyces heliomycini TaxID=284032 RepID=A0ABV5LAB0_9ACTN
MNRWVGIVSLRDTAAPTPVYRIALAIEAARKRTSYSLGGRQVSYERMRRALRRVGQTYAARSEWDRWSYCVDLAGDFFDGSAPVGDLPRWLTGGLRSVLDGETGPTGRRTRRHKPQAAARPGSRGSVSPRQKKTTPGTSSARTAPARPTRAGQRPAAEPSRPYIRVERQCALRDVTYPPLPRPPISLTGTFGEVVRAAVQDAAGKWEAGEDVTAWLGLAASHRSHLYESGLAETAVTPHVLGMLDALGRTTLGVILIDAYVGKHQPEKVGTQSSEHHRRSAAARVALGQWAADHGLVRMGAGEAQRPAPSVAEGVARQILGVLSLIGAHDTARRLVGTVCADVDRAVDGLSGADPVTEAQNLFAKEGLTYDYTEQGPDHSKTYTATARTRSGRTAQGTAPTKKAARAAAARALLHGHPQGRRRQEEQAVETRFAARPQPYSAAPLRHRDAVSDLAAMFELDGRRSEGLLGQALTHSSYVYENQAVATAHHQRDNQLLAHHGSVVLDHLARHERTRRTLAQGLVPDEDEARIHTPANEDTARLGTELALAEGVLTGRGENGQRPSTVAGAAQAVVATAWRTHGTRLLHHRPAALDDWLTGLQHRHDPVTVLTYLMSMFGVTHVFEHQLTGPDHLQRFTSTAVLRDARDRTHRWAVPPDGPCSKTDADKATAQDILEVLSAPADDLVDALTPAESDLLRYLLRAQLDGLGPTNERQRARMVSGGLLGTDLLATGDLDAFRTWAERVESLLGPDAEPLPGALRELYRQLVHDTRLGPRSLVSRMAADEGTDHVSTVRRNASEAVRRAARTGPRDVSARDIVQDWWRDQASRTGVTVRDDMRQDVALSLPSQLSALHETLTWCGEAAEAAGTPIDVELTVQDGTLHAWIGLHEVDVRAACDDFARLLSRTLPCTDCLVDDDHVLLRLHGLPGTPTASPLEVAGLDAYLSNHIAMKEPISLGTP